MLIYYYIKEKAYRIKLRECKFKIQLLQELIRNYRNKSNAEIISKYKNLSIKWDKVMENKVKNKL